MWKVYPKWTSVLLFINVQLSVTYCGPFNLIFFCKKNNTNCIRFFCRFQILEKWANLRLPLNFHKPKVFQLQGASAPGPLTRGSAWTPLGAPPLEPRYRGSQMYLGASTF